MTTAEIARKMVSYSNGNRHDVNHFMKVYAFAKTIGVCEGLDKATQDILEIAAIVHDIACPLCREKYGNTNGKYQELEGPALGRDFLSDGPDHQILIEADYLVNVDESGYSRENVENTLERIFRTETGRALLRAMYL